MKTNPPFGRVGWGLEQGQKFLIDVAQGAVVLEKAFVDFGESFEDRGIGHELFAHFDEGANDINAHGHGAVGVQDSGRHERAVFGEDPGKALATAARL